MEIIQLVVKVETKYIEHLIGQTTCKEGTKKEEQIVKEKWVVNVLISQQPSETGWKIGIYP